MPPKRVLLTGANTLIGSHILDHLLSFELSVRAVVASKNDVQSLHQRYPPLNPRRLDFAVVSPHDGAVPGAYDDALDTELGFFDAVIHTVAADPAEEADCLSRFIHLETESLINFLRSVRDVAPKTQRVVIVTCLTPFARWLVDPQVERIPRRGSLSAPTVAEIDTENVLTTSQAGNNIVAEALWKWNTDTRSHFELVSVTAPSVYGPSIQSLKNSSDLEEANRRIWNICSNDSSERVTSPPFGIDFFTDVRDLAFATVQAVFTSHAGNKRFMVSAGTMPPGSVIAEFLASRFPELGGRVHADGSPPRRPPSGNPPLDFVDNRHVASILQLTKYRQVEETLGDVARQIIDLHRQKEWKRVIES
ncbi:hypothetical protein B0J11DRAFT_83753 [Dendryphion nanum]|uniref:NAD-dependent epimerase/dehydratase domain-containing protein n=1 Tax=Dendryphion nanum TaxID=256645 RepID=A0A9P9IGE5_9PLEO|nr:hypothetical protein B0J11DRAFT_83753 [Dendryphion nanum]